MTPPLHVDDDFVETWKGIAAFLRRSERWCRYMTRVPDPLPVFRVGGVVRVRIEDLNEWLERQRSLGMAAAFSSGHPDERPLACVACFLVTKKRLEEEAVRRGVTIAEVLEGLMRDLDDEAALEAETVAAPAAIRIDVVRATSTHCVRVVSPSPGDVITEPGPIPVVVKPLRSCNRHADCDAAEAAAVAAGRRRPDHCDDGTCEDCFGS